MKKEIEPIGYCCYCQAEVFNINNKIICPNCGDVVAKNRKYIIWEKESQFKKEVNHNDV